MYFSSKFGCYLDKPKKKRKFKANKKKGKQIKKSTEPFKRKKTFFKKKYKKEITKPASKQIQKQDCKCWCCSPRQINFVGTYSNELFEQITGYEEVSPTDIESSDEIIVLTYLSSSEDESEDGT